jgi:hypothetical protein
MKKITLLFRSAAISLCAASSLLLLSGCASPMQSKALIPVGFKVPRQYSASVIVHVEGGAKKSEGGNLEISVPLFREALAAAIIECQTFSSVREQPPADYHLSVSLVRTKNKAFTSNETLSARWQLTRLSDNSVRLNEFVTTSGKATLGDAVVGATRMRIALERAGQENIKQGLTKLSELNLN